MPTIHLHKTTTATPEQVLAGITDFGPGRSELFPNSADDQLVVHDQGSDHADVTEGGKGNWERLHYDWSDPNRIVMTTTDSNVWGDDSVQTYTLAAKPDGTTDMDVVLVARQEPQGTLPRPLAWERRQGRPSEGAGPDRQGDRGPGLRSESRRARLGCSIPLPEAGLLKSGRLDSNQRPLGPQPTGGWCRCVPGASHASRREEWLDVLDTAVGTKAVPRRSRVRIGGPIRFSSTPTNHRASTPTGVTRRSLLLSREGRSAGSGAPRPSVWNPHDGQ